MRNAPTKRPASAILSLRLPGDVRRRLELLGARLGRTTEECACMALEEFLEAWEGHLREVSEIEDGHGRPCLSVPAE